MTYEICAAVVVGNASETICDRDDWATGVATAISDTVLVGATVAACDAEGWCAASVSAVCAAVVVRAAVRNVVLVMKV